MKQAIAKCKLLDSQIDVDFSNASNVKRFSTIHYPLVSLLFSSAGVTVGLLCCPQGKYLFIILSNYNTSHQKKDSNNHHMMLANNFLQG